MNPPARRGLVAEIGRFVRANLASTIASGVEYVLVTGLVIAHAHYLYAATAGAVTGAIIDFSLKRHWAFDRTVKSAVHHEGLRYLAVSATSLGLNLALSYALVDGLRLPAVPGVIAASLVVGFAWNYPLHRLYVFRAARRFPEPVLGRPERRASLGDRLDAGDRAAHEGRP
jgi:putative flippase GtrA